MPGSAAQRAALRRPVMRSRCNACPRLEFGRFETPDGGLAMLDNKGISAPRLNLALAVLVSLPLLYFLGTMALIFIGTGVVAVVAVSAVLARSRRPDQT